MNSAGLYPHFALLGFLYLQPMHGYDLHKHLQANLCEVWQISQSQAYAVLKRLQRMGWVQASPQADPAGKRPARACFELTAAGRAAFERWLYSPTPSSARALRVEFLTRLFFASQLGAGQEERLLQEQRSATRASLQELRGRLEQLPADQRYNRLGIELRIRQLGALLEWMETCAADQLR